jgi:ribosomal protein S12 methylthiotransferase
VLREAEQLLNAGVKELLVISQDTSAYGRDVKYAEHSWRGAPVKTKFLDLTAALGDLAAEHGAWVRLHYVYPYPHVDAVIPLMAESKVLPYLDIPFQHASANVLRAMKRPAHAEKILDRIKVWRRTCPDLTIRSSFIVGFPGETEEDFETLLDFIEEAGIDRAGCFKYENVEGAASRDLSDHVDQDEIDDRHERFMNLQMRLAHAQSQKLIGKTLDVLIDGYDEDEGAFAARTKADAPEIDGLVFVEADDLEPGAFARATITEADGHTLRGTL